MKLLPILLFLIVTSSHAKLVQFIHTNDLHSFFNGSRSGKGGYARLKTKVERLKAEGKSKNIPTLYLDGGDFGEGSTFFMSDEGRDSLRLLDHLGVDVAVLGNHDFMLGGQELRNQILDSGVKAKILSANFGGKNSMGLSELLPSYVDFNFNGVKMRIFGLTTSELHYQYPLRPQGFMAPAHNTGIKMAEKAQRDKVDFLVALTHIGLERDIHLVTKTRSIDLVVGGHSHTMIPRPEMTKNLSGRHIPIVQAGAHSLYVGALLMDIQPNGKSTVVDYRMYDITQELSEDQEMRSFIEKAHVKRERYFDRRWDEVIGFSEIKLSGLVDGQRGEQRTCWSKHVARLTRIAGGAQLGLQFDVFHGEQIPPGPIRYGDVIDNFPHFRKFGDQGWKISKAWISGFVLKKILTLLANTEEGLQVTVDGLQASTRNKKMEPFKLNRHKIYQARLNGERLSNLRYYSIALPNEIPYAILKTINIFGHLLLNNLQEIPNTDYWRLLENYITENSPLRCLED